MEGSTRFRKPHTSTADRQTRTVAPPSASCNASASSQRCSGRYNQPSNVISKVPFGGQVNADEAQSLSKKEMDDQKIIITYGGNWEENAYKGGMSELLFVSPNITYEALLGLVHEIVAADLNSCLYDLRCLLKTEGKMARFKIKNDRDLSYVLRVGNVTSEIYVTVEQSQHVNQQALQQQNQPNHQSFLQLLASQFASVSHSNYIPGSVPVFEQQSCTRTSAERVGVASNELEDGRLIPKHDTSLLESIYSNEDECFTDESNGYMEPEHVGREQGTNVRRKWVIPGFENYSIQPIPYEREPDDDDLYKGAIFSSKEEIKTNLGMLALQEKFEFRIKRSTNTRFVASCKDIGCKFKLCATRLQRGFYWRISKFVKDHSCQVDLFNGRPRKVTTKVVSTFIVPRLLDNGRVIRPRDVIEALRVKHGINISYSKACKAKEYAQNLIYGDPLQSFQLLPSYLYMLEKENPGTVTKLKTDDENRFEFLFWALGPCLNGFRSCCRPVIVIDGTHLKGKFQSFVFVAVTKDGNEQIYPVAFGIANEESDRSWTWFLNELHNVIGSPPDLMIVSDCHKNIENAINEVFPERVHGLCTYHLKQNLKKFKNSDVSTIYDNASQLYQQSDFDEQMKQLRKIHGKAYCYLVEVGVEKWSRAYSPVRRYEFMTSNIAKDINSRMRDAQKLPICTLIEFTRDMLQQWFYDRRKNGESCDTKVTEWASLHVNNSLDAAQHMSMHLVDNFIYHVNDGQKVQVVNLNERTCTCRRFDLDLLPCAHAAAAISYAKQSLFSFCAEYYHASTLVESYPGGICPVLNPEDWEVPKWVKAKVVNPPEY